jgi:outer membrane protein TolC
MTLMEITIMKKYLLLLLIPTILFAQEKKTLTIEEAIQLGLDNSNMLHISQNKVAAAEAKSSEVNANRLPSLKAQASYTRLSDVDPFAVTLPMLPTPVVISPTVLDQYNTRLTLQQPLFTGFKLSKSADAAEYNAKATNFDFEKDKQDMVYNIKAAYWSLFKAIEVSHVIDENVQQVKAHLIDVNNMLRQGLVTKNEVLKVEVQLSSSEVAQIDAANNVQIAMMNLNSLIGLPLETDIQIKSAIQIQSKELPLDGNFKIAALESRPDLKSAAYRMQAADASVTAANSGWYPQINLFSNYYYSSPNLRYQPTKDEFKDTWDVGIGLSWDIWNWGLTKHQSDQSKAVYEQTRYAERQLKDAVALEVNQSYMTFVQSGKKINVARQGVDQADENFRITRSKFANGTATNTELLDAEVALLQSKLNYTVSLVDNELTYAKLLKALGKEN